MHSLSQKSPQEMNFFPKKLPCIQVPSICAKYAHMATEKTFVAFDSQSPHA